MSWQDDREWDPIRQRLEGIEADVPRQIPPWRLAGLGLVQVAVIIGAAVLVLPFVGFLTDALTGSLGEPARPVALGAATFVWTTASLGGLALMARLVSGGVLGVPRRDWLFALLLYLTLGAWQTGIGLWQLTELGQLEADAVGPATRIWPMLVLAASLLLAARPLASPRASRGLWMTAALVAALLALQVLSEVAGALRDGHVSPAGLAIGVVTALQLLVLGAWLVRAAR